MKRMSLILAFLLAPIAPFVVYFLSTVDALQIIALFGVVFAWPIALPFMIPAYFWLKRHPAEQRPRTCVAFGALWGLLIGFVLGGALKEHFLMLALVLAAHGGLSGYLFWLLARPALTAAGTEAMA